MVTLLKTDALIVSRKDPETGRYSSVGVLSHDGHFIRFMYDDGVTRALPGLPLGRVHAAPRCLESVPRMEQRSPKRGCHERVNGPERGGRNQPVDGPLGPRTPHPRKSRGRRHQERHAYLTCRHRREAGHQHRRGDRDDLRSHPSSRPDCPRDQRHRRVGSRSVTGSGQTSGSILTSAGRP